MQHFFKHVIEKLHVTVSHQRGDFNNFFIRTGNQAAAFFHAYALQVSAEGHFHKFFELIAQIGRTVSECFPQAVQRDIFGVMLLHVLGDIANAVVHFIRLLFLCQLPHGQN